MGFYDRDYQRGDYNGSQPGIHLIAPQTITTKLVIVMFGIYVLQILTQSSQPVSPIDDGWFTNTFRLYADVFRRPWAAFELLTYGFLHDVGDLRHILFNMLALWFFGRPVEYRYGPRKFLSFFLAAIVFAGVTWVLAEFVAHRRWLPIPMLGASGGIAAVLILFCLNFPRQMIYIWGVLPIPAWIFAIMFVGQDVFGATGRHGQDGADVAFTAHLGGALFGFMYYQWGGHLDRWLPNYSLRTMLRPKPKLRVLDPDTSDSNESRVDEILKKIQEQGQDSLTRGERRILEQASREYQKKRQ